VCPAGGSPAALFFCAPSRLSFTSKIFKLPQAMLSFSNKLTVDPLPISSSAAGRRQIAALSQKLIIDTLPFSTGAVCRTLFSRKN
jgi:hypothetical protein